MSELETQDQMERHSRGREAFLAMMRAWRSRSGLSLSDLTELCEAAMRADLAPGVPDWEPKGLAAGELVVSHGVVWRALVAIKPGGVAPQRSGDHEGFEQVATVKRMFTSQIHTLERGQAQNIGSVVFDVLGTANQWLAGIRSGRTPLPAGRLAEKAQQATVIEDADGPYGPRKCSRSTWGCCSRRSASPR